MPHAPTPIDGRVKRTDTPYSSNTTLHYISPFIEVGLGEG